MPALSADSLSPPGRLPKSKLLAVHLVWLLLAVMVALTLAASPFRYRELSQPCVGARCMSDNALLVPDTVAVLTAMGISLRQYAGFQLGIAFIHLMISWLLAVIVLRQPEKDRMMILVAIFLSLGGTSNPVISSLPVAFPWMTIPIAALLVAGYISFVLVFYLFPDGRFIPPWTRWLALILVIDELVLMILTTYMLATNRVIVIPWFGLLDGSIWLMSFLAIIAAQVYRYYRISNAVQRLQTRWVVFGSSITIFIGVALVVAGQLMGEASQSWYPLVITFFGSWLSVTILVTLGIAILRYRLFDIDIIIRKTLVYSLLTGLLGLVYFGGVVLLQGILTTDRGPRTAGDAAMSGQPSAVVIVVTTLVIAALFNPLRRRVQDFIDRRFYRQKYDAEKALAEFATAARSETDLKQLSSRLTRTVQESLQPEQVGLWLFQNKKS
jgi:hypothetical protein